MTDDRKPLPSETFFLPPLKMVLAFFDRDAHERTLSQRTSEEQTDSDEKTVERLIEKLSEKDE